MTVFPAPSLPTSTSTPTPTGGGRGSLRHVAMTRAGAAVLWAIGFLAALHGRQVVIGSAIPLGVGLLLAAYPLIDVAATLFERRRTLVSAASGAALVIDGLAVAGLFAATLTLNTDAVLIGFGTWAFASGLLQLANAWRAERSCRAKLPLLLSGGISAVAGVSFAALAAQDTAHLAGLGGCAILGAIFFAVWTLVDRG